MEIRKKVNVKGESTAKKAAKELTAGLFRRGVGKLKVPGRSSRVLGKVPRATTLSPRKKKKRGWKGRVVSSKLKLLAR